MIRQHLIDVGDRKVELWRGGSGTPLVFLHSSLGEFSAPEFVERLGDGFEIFAPAHPGFGQSTGIEDTDDVEDLAFHYLAVIDALGIAPPHLVGLSLGGWIAAEIAVRWPERLASLTVVDGLGLWLDEAPIAPIWGPQPPELVGVLFADASHPLAQMMLAFDLDNPPPEDILVPFINSQAATAKIGWNPYLHDPKLASRLPRVSCPTLVIWGEADKLVPLPYGRRYAELIQGARLEIIPGGGHMVALEQPARVGQLLADFLAQHARPEVVAPAG